MRQTFASPKQAHAVRERENQIETEEEWTEKFDRITVEHMKDGAREQLPLSCVMDESSGCLLGFSMLQGRGRRPWQRTTNWHAKCHSW